MYILRSLSDEPLERQLADQELRRLLELANFTKRDSTRTRTEPVRLLDAAGGRRRLSDRHFLAALVARAFKLRGALPPVDFRAVCLVLAMALKAGSF